MSTLPCKCLSCECLSCKCLSCKCRPLVFDGPRGSTYEGFFFDHGRSGPGTLFKGNVKHVYDPRSGKKALRSNRIYEGNWRAGQLRTGSMVGPCCLLSSPTANCFKETAICLTPSDHKDLCHLGVERNVFVFVALMPQASRHSRRISFCSLLTAPRTSKNVG